MLKKVVNEEGLADWLLADHKETVRHMLRMSKLAREFGVFLRLKDKDVELLVKCALLHDIGKLSISKEILYKKGKLTEEEFEYIKTHTHFKLKKGKDKDIINNCIGGHHISCNNKGYGNVENYDNVHRNTKIVSILDVYDVMSNKRSYKTFKMSTEDIIVEIIKCRGTQLDRFYANKFIEFIEVKESEKIETTFN